MAIVNLTLEDITGDTEDEDNVEVGLAFLGKETDRADVNGLTQAVIIGLVFKKVMEDPEKIAKVLSLVDPQEVVMELLVADQTIQ